MESRWDFTLKKKYGVYPEKPTTKNIEILMFEVHDHMIFYTFLSNPLIMVWLSFI